MYGIDDKTRKLGLEKIKKQKDYFKNNFFEIGNDLIPMSDLIKNAYHNADKYIAEVNHRVYSLFHYANNNNLKCIFGTLTLPTEYHPKINNKYKNPKYCNGHLIKNPTYCIYTRKQVLDYDKYSPKAGARELSKMFKRLLDLRFLKDIDKEDKCYFRVYEPHKDGTPHLHFSLFVPENIHTKIHEKIQNYFNKNYPNLKTDFQIDIKNPVAYLMKYILKTFDDLRENDKVTDLSLWYITNKITRFYTSRTLITLEVFRKLNGRYNLLELTHMYKQRDLHILVDIDTNKIVSIHDSIGNIYKKRETKLVDTNGRITLKYKKKVKEPKLIIDGVRHIQKDNKLIKFKPLIPIKQRSTETLLNDLKELLLTSDYDSNYYALINNELIYRDFKYFDIETMEVKCNDILSISSYEEGF
ncbi:MAG: hypothetical protein C0625_08390 [Arcobacter sp.]|nr:MAG: hypothetical protein C0625_08390 [Arcobacter sp.]